MPSGVRWMSGGVIILAAGFSRRFGSDKRCHRLPDGRTLLQATYAQYRAVFDDVVLVVRDEDQALVAQFGSPETVVSHDAALGMGHSLASGVRERNHWDYLFVALGDMPYITEDTLMELKQTMTSANDGAIVLPIVQGQPGHPVGFSPLHYPALAGLKGDRGARSVLTGEEHHIVELAVADEGVLRDLDTPPEAD